MYTLCSELSDLYKPSFTFFPAHCIRYKVSHIHYINYCAISCMHYVVCLSLLASNFAVELSGFQEIGDKICDQKSIKDTWTYLQPSLMYTTPVHLVDVPKTTTYTARSYVSCCINAFY